MRLNRRATFCLGITRQDIDSIRDPIACGDWPARRMEYSARPRTGLFDDMMARTAFPVVVPASKSGGCSQGVTLLEPGLTRPLRCLVVKPKRALLSNRSA